MILDKLYTSPISQEDEENIDEELPEKDEDDEEDDDWGEETE